ncbi:DUF6503 family protein [Formosa algae]|uniref:Deoxyribose-phosphate aldolase n=1 Tax=Formosa algae TaxID=225843 RepID=A0A9X1C8P1_9FLAO|nr:DUF6503 family protein [Formosa algae]MBP1839566.1 hypothetical protein [Formosa algae]MDQ0334870.1 hypothetical protein [Formosa algae]OEI82112.1 hypothetical protein AST99_01345 [Formosa algae]
MRSLKLVLIIFTIGLFASCQSTEKKKVISTEVTKDTIPDPSEIPVSLSESEKIIQESIEAHGGDLYDSANYSFVFRKNTFQFKNDKSNYEYTKTYKKGDSLIVDVLKSGDFSRSVNGSVVELSDKDIAVGTGAINSVIYFATLPYKLSDKAVNSKLIEKITVKGENYYAIQVTFDEEGGGEDHDDHYFYWINTKTKKIDFLAYNYSVNEGGVRFRVGYNKSVVDGITFQDYTNYEAAVGTPLKDLPKLYEANSLKELSKIKTENVINLNK